MYDLKCRDNDNNLGSLIHLGDQQASQAITSGPRECIMGGYTETVP